MLEATVIGSMPVELDSKRYARKYLEHEYDTPYPALIKQAVDAQVEAGVEIVSDGQTRRDFVKLYASGFKGVLIQDRPQVVDEVAYNGPITLEDQEFVKSILPDAIRLKGIVTGPYTLAKNCVDQHYGDVQELAHAFAEGLAKEVEHLDKVVDFLQVDEPMMGVDYPEYGRDLIETVYRKASKPRMFHACGDVSQVFENFTGFPVDVLEHEFAANPSLLETVSECDFHQKIGYGCVRSDSMKVETVRQIKKHLQKGINEFGAEEMMVCPDCGMRNLTPTVAKKKLENMVDARDQLMD